eukprot:2312157-Pleurochrysis_carterae.AAC.2
MTRPSQGSSSCRSRGTSGRERCPAPVRCPRTRRALNLDSSKGGEGGRREGLPTGTKEDTKAQE